MEGALAGSATYSNGDDETLDRILVEAVRRRDGDARIDWRVDALRPSIAATSYAVGKPWILFSSEDGASVPMVVPKSNRKGTMKLELGLDVLRSYKRLPYKAWHALAEFVDNSTQSYFNNKAALDKCTTRKAHA